MASSGKKPGRPGAVRRTSRGPAVGSGGQGRQALEGKKPTPKAEDRPYHPAGKAKAAKERYAAAGGKGKPGAPAHRNARRVRRARERDSGAGDESGHPDSRGDEAGARPAGRVRLGAPGSGAEG